MTLSIGLLQAIKTFPASSIRIKVTPDQLLFRRTQPFFCFLGELFDFSKCEFLDIKATDTLSILVVWAFFHLRRPQIRIKVQHAEPICLNRSPAFRFCVSRGLWRGDRGGFGLMGYRSPNNSRNSLISQAFESNLIDFQGKPFICRILHFWYLAFFLVLYLGVRLAEGLGVPPLLFF